MADGGGGDDEQRGARIVFSLEAQEAQKSVLDEERERHRTRAERFGAEYKDPASLPRYRNEVVRRERVAREGFATGIDLFSEEELAKKAARAKKFGLPEERAAAAAYAPDPEELRRAARAAKFGVAYAPPRPEALAEKADLFEPPKHAPEDLPRRENAIYLYGVDVMSTGDVLGYFDAYAPTFVEWINDSSCCVVFEDAATTRRAIAGSGHPLAADELASAPDAMDGAVSMELDAAGRMPFLWHKGRDFVKQRPGGAKPATVPLMYRMATDLDQIDPHAERRSRHLWQQRQQQRQQQQQHGGPGSGGKRQRQQLDGDGDAQMGDADGGGGGGEGDGQQGRRARKRRSGGGRRREPRDPHGVELPFEEVPQPDDVGDGGGGGDAGGSGAGDE